MRNWPDMWMLCLIEKSDCDLLWYYSSCFHHEELTCEYCVWLRNLTVIYCGITVAVFTMRNWPDMWILCLIQKSDCDLLWCYSSCFHHEELARVCEYCVWFRNLTVIYCGVTVAVFTMRNWPDMWILCLIEESDCDLLWCYSSCFHHEELARHVNIVFDWGIWLWFTVVLQ